MGTGGDLMLKIKRGRKLDLLKLVSKVELVSKVVVEVW